MGFYRDIRLRGGRLVTGLVRGVLDRAVQKKSAALARTYDPKQTIVVTGSARSGTTWLAEQVGHLKGTLYVWEPLDPSSRPEVLDLGFGYDPEITDLNALPKNRFRYIDSFVRGRDLKLDHLQTTGSTKIGAGLKLVGDLALFERILVKCVRSNLSIHAIQRHYQCKAIFLIRDPRAVVNSQMSYAWKGALAWKDRWQGVLESHCPNLISVMVTLASDAEVLAFDWAIANTLPFSPKFSGDVLVMHYEDLIQHQHGELERLKQHLDLGRDADIGRNLHIPSKTSFRSPEALERYGSEPWKRELPAEIENAIMVVVNKVIACVPREWSRHVIRYL